jgi:hypothetical protein
MAHYTSSLSDLKNRSENSAGRGQISPVLQVNSRSIDQKSGEICTGQADLQPISFKSDRLLGCQKTSAKSLVMSDHDRIKSITINGYRQPFDKPVLSLPKGSRRTDDLICVSLMRAAEMRITGDYGAGPGRGGCRQDGTRPSAGKH